MTDTIDTTQPRPIEIAAFTADPHGVLAQHRAEHWWAPFEGSNFIEVLSYDDVRALLADDERFPAALNAYIDGLVASNPEIPAELAEAMREDGRRSLINLDGERHRKLRSLVSRTFTPRSVAALSPFLEELSGRLAKQLEPGSDFMASFARELPARALCELTGIPGKDQAQFVAWIDLLEVQLQPQVLRTMDRRTATRVLEAQRSLREYTMALAAQRRSDPRDDLVSRMVAEGAGEFGDETIARLIADLVFAGNDTTRNALGLAVMVLAENRDWWERLAEAPEHAAHVVDEVLRMEPPAPGPIRCAAAGAEHRGHQFEPGQPMGLSIWSANRDEGHWGEMADEFDPGREHVAEHLSFGHGPHFCLGASLAREEMRAALVALTGHLTNVRVIEKPRMHPPGSIHGPVELKIDFRRR